MSTTEPDQPYVPSDLARWLFYADTHGEPSDPDDAIADALDGAWIEREPIAAALLTDHAADPYEHFLAMSALVAWGSPHGYEAVVQAAADPDAVDWKGESVDRWFGADNTFALLAQAVADSRDMAVKRQCTAERIKALRALLGLTDRYYFERYLSVQGLLTVDIAELRTPITAAVKQGLHRLADAQNTGFDLATQIAGLIVALGQVDRVAATEYARTLLATDPGSRTERELAPVLD